MDAEGKGGLAHLLVDARGMPSPTFSAPAKDDGRKQAEEAQAATKESVKVRFADQGCA